MVICYGSHRKLVQGLLLSLMVLSSGSFLHVLAQGSISKVPPTVAVLYLRRMGALLWGWRLGSFTPGNDLCHKQGCEIKGRHWASPSVSVNGALVILCYTGLFSLWYRWAEVPSESVWGCSFPSTNPPCIKLRSKLTRGGGGGPCWCSATHSCLTLCDPMDCSMPGFPVLHRLPELVQTYVH